MSRVSKFFLLAFATLLQQYCFAQRTGLVLSGGGASGVAHIGVLKALEENNIPIDYITGSSIGALVGAMYSAGYSPKQIEQLVLSENFRNQAYGNIEEKYVYYFKRKDDNASWINFKLDSSLITTLPTNVISPLVVDFGLMKMFAGPAAAADYNFDSLFVPFRCLASDIEEEKSVVFKSGDLGEAVRASMSYPFYLKPISINGKLLFDGGLYNNFPSNVICEEFKPDYIIGSNVTSNAPPADEDNLYSQIRSMLVSRTNFNLSCAEGLIIEPKTDVALFDFDEVQSLIDSGYAATLRNISIIKNKVERRTDAKELEAKRAGFLNKQPKTLIDKINVEGVDRKPAQYIKKVLRHKGKYVDMDKMAAAYFRLAADDKVKNIYPKAKYNKATGLYDLNLKIKKEKRLIAYFGGNFSNRPINTGFAGVQYNYLGTAAVTLFGNLYFGKLYTSTQAKARIDVPTNLPFYIEPTFTFNRWDFYKSSTEFFTDEKPAYLIQNEEFGELNFGIPASYKGKVTAGGAFGKTTNKYYQTDQFSLSDTSDRTDFYFSTANLNYELNSLNRKQYANSGTYLTFKARYVRGSERHTPGSTGIDTSEFRKRHEWVQFKLIADQYFNRRGRMKFGVYGEAAFSAQTLFNNYTATVLSAPAFYPIPESKTLFLEEMRAYKYLAGGLKTIFNIMKTFELRLEGYIFAPYQSINKQVDLTAGYGEPFAAKRYIATSALVYQTPLGPLSFSVNYYDQKEYPYTFLLHFGYMIFNRRALD